MSEPTELSDEALADIVHRAFNSSDENLDPNHDPWLDVARALRAALCPPVAPLAPGETVTIPDADDGLDGLYTLRIERTDDTLNIAFMIGLDEDDMRALNLAGVRQLELVCRRARAAMEGDE